MSIEQTTSDELNEFKTKLADNALKAKEANRRHRLRIKEKLSLIKTDDRIGELLDLVQDIKRRLEHKHSKTK
jgi:hypothetical protein